MKLLSTEMTNKLKLLASQYVPMPNHPTPSADLHCDEDQTHDYEFYKFSRLVTDVLVNPNQVAIPYDIEFGIVESAYLRYINNYNECEISDPYEHMVMCIKEDQLLRNDLIQHNESTSMTLS